MADVAPSPGRRVLPRPVGQDGPTATGPLQPIEVATAALLGSMTMLFVVAGAFLPHASVVAALGTVPTGVVAYRHRARAVVASMVAATAVGFLVAGSGVLSSIFACGLVGGLAGHAHRRRWHPLRLAGAVAVLAPLVGAGVVGALLVLSQLRRLTLDALRASWKGLASLFTVVHLRGVTDWLDVAIDKVIANWEPTVFVSIAVGMAAATFGAWWLLAGLLHRLDALTATDHLAGGPDSSDHGAAVLGGRPTPVPVCLEEVSVRYPAAARPALDGVSLRIEPGEAVVLAGPNGSGKSTLSRLLAGAEPTSGRVCRPGPVGLGQLGGTALIAQRPESQVLGVRVRDDVVWGLPADRDVPVEALLVAVGLDGMGARETSGLSGGQLQRLAVAAALARRPRLLLSDESTAMIDRNGRQRLMELLGALPAARGVTVVHATHRPEELATAARTLHLDAGHLVPVASRHTAANPRPRLEVQGLGAVRPARLVLDDVSCTYADGTPWAHEALTGVSLRIAPGDGVVVVGDNGSGKSTLAWILAGLTRPTGGTALLDGQPVDRQVGRVGLAFQHARLQLQRSRVGPDVAAAGGVDRAAAERALALVGLDPVELWRRPVDELSGGQARRVAVAGLLARRPSVLVLDEPLAGLDAESRDGLVGVLAAMRAEVGLSVVIISHDLDGVDDVCDRLVRLDAGRVVEDRALVAGAVLGS